jgi:hypothetical protein
MIQHNKKLRHEKKELPLLENLAWKKEKRKYLKKMLEKTWDFLLAGY